jgi:peptidoglycan/xylan/chitin deacetylase (PgdA/CDA1 family)
VSSALSVVMYHYVRPLVGSRYPRIRGLTLADFEGQLDYLERHYRAVSAVDVVRAAREDRPLPERPVLLTFDDGYSDHYHFVLPALRRRGMTGVFFPTSGSVEDRRMLDVNKLHFILASVGDAGELVRNVDAAVDAARGELELAPLDLYRSQHLLPNRFDTAEVNYVKRMLQVALPEALRRRVVAQLFATHVSADERSFADDLYVSVEQLREMHDAGMEIGSHGHAHHWLDSLAVDAQARDIDRSLDMLERIGVPREHFYFCYPYGGYTSDTVRLLAARSCDAAFTTRVALIQPAPSNLLELPRLDTNDLPRRGSAQTVAWTHAAARGPEAAVEL